MKSKLNIEILNKIIAVMLEDEDEKTFKKLRRLHMYEEVKKQCKALNSEKLLRVYNFIEEMKDEKETTY